MPEEIEVDTDKLREEIAEGIDKAEAKGRQLTRVIAVTTAILAALAAIASLKAGATVNEALVLKTEATQLQAQASDQWTYYQAKGIKGAVADAEANAWRAAGKTPPAEILANVTRYAQEQKAISDTARAKEQDRDRHSGEADELLQRHHVFANAVALFQVAIALGAVAALTRSLGVLVLSLISGLAGLAFFLTNIVR